MGERESDLAWFRFFHHRWLAGTISLRPEDRGLYIGVICLIIEFGGPIPDDDVVIARRLGVNPRTWRASRLRLVEGGKLSIVVQECNTECGLISRSFLANFRAEREAKHSRNSSELQRERSLKRWSKRAKNKETSNAAGYAAADAAGYARRGEEIYPLKVLNSGQEEIDTNDTKVAPDGQPYPAPGRRKNGTNPRANGTDLRSRGANPRAVAAAAEQQRIDEVDPEHRAKVAAWAIKRGFDLLSVNQTDIERARQLGFLQSASEPQQE